MPRQSFFRRLKGEQLTVELFYRIDPKGQEQNYYKIKLEEAIIVNMREYNPLTFDPDSKPYHDMEEVGFTYSKITWAYTDGNIEFSICGKTTNVFHERKLLATGPFFAGRGIQRAAAGVRGEMFLRGRVSDSGRMAMRERLLERIRGVQSAPDLRMRPTEKPSSNRLLPTSAKISQSPARATR